jgi:uncharacterized protein YyaL (SSP411 family)
VSNHLLTEKSPYLQQHAHNPVDWYPWGPEAFEKARREQKPIFLSVGYSTCHWCHVMERESFENEDIARLVNRDFISIKVDREERPDVDRIYMTFVQATTGSGGWPMTVFLTPALEPFFGGTYFPPDNRYGRPGFPVLLERIAEAWRNDREKIVASGGDILTQLRQSGGAEAATHLDRGVLDSCFHYFRRTFDRTRGGFGEAPKFPRPSVLNFLLRYHAGSGSEEALEMVLQTLASMAAGGMNDQLGGGFHRYSVDERWFVPHFEKMLYDQAQLAVSYLEAFQITREPFFGQIAESILEYVLRDLKSPEGGFYSAEDADSAADPARPKEKSEGAFYIWSQAELGQLLGPVTARPDTARIFAARYGVEPGGNVQNDPHGEFTGRNILFVAQPPEPGTDAALRRALDILLQARNRRPRPHLDDKILVSWNGLMISAFAKAARILDQPRYFQAARSALDFVLTKLYDGATLKRRYRDGEAAVDGFLDDYAFLIAALLDVYEAGYDPGHLETALTLTAKMRELFEDQEQGAFFTTAEGDENLVLRMKDDYDGAEPSGNSIALMDLLRLANLTDSPDLLAAAQRALHALSRRIASQPPAVPQMLVAVAESLAKKQQIVIAGDPAAPDTRALLQAVNSRFLPHSILLLAGSEEHRRQLSRHLPAISSMLPVEGHAAAYVCQNYACQLPATTVAHLMELLQ